jgi:hypothetical protein
MLGKETFHIGPQHQTLKELQRVQNNLVVLPIFRSSSTQQPDLLTKPTNRFLHILLIFAGVKEDRLESCPLALEHMLATISQTHDCLENFHPPLQVVLEFGMQVLIVQIIKYLHEQLQNYDFTNIVGVIEYAPKDSSGQIDQEVMHLVAHDDDLLVQRVTASHVGVFVTDTLDHLQHRRN